MSDATASDSNESQYGFKDKDKAEKTLILLESHDMQYRKLTVRGLLRRAKRVLTLTKAQDKIQNIKEAIQVFENWLAVNATESAKANVKTNVKDKVETVPGFCFKDKQAAERSLAILKDRDPEYQKFAIKGLLLSSNRVLASTKNEEKIQNIKEGVKVLKDFLEKFENENFMKNNRSYLPKDILDKLPKPQNKLQLEFLEAYGGAKAKGNYKHLRTMYPADSTDTTWDIIRNRNIEEVLKQNKANDNELFDANTGSPTEYHLKLIHWAYSPEPEKLKAYVKSKNETTTTTTTKVEKRKRVDEECEIKRKKTE